MKCRLLISYCFYSFSLIANFNKNKFGIIFSLVLAGEMIFGLPYHVIRYFRPTFLEVFQLNNAQIGDAFALYGVTAMLSYFPSGLLADRFSPRKLMSISLFITALGGLFFASIPDMLGLTLLFGFWGISNILLFWSAMLALTRNWGGETSQGLAFGLLDGGRGLLGAGMATVAVFLLTLFLPDDPDLVNQSQRTQAMKMVILFYTALTAIAGLVVWLVVPEQKSQEKNYRPLKGVKEVMTKKSVWLQAIIIVSAYCGYRGLDYYALYGVEVWGISEVDSAKLMSSSTYLRPVGAILAGVLADRFRTGRMVSVSYLLLILTYLVFIQMDAQDTAWAFFLINMVFSFLAVFALRGIYFAFFEESNIPHRYTGTAAGIVSVIGYTPDIFFNPIVGRIIDSTQSVQAYQQFFWLLTGIMGVGFVSVLILEKINRSRNQ